MPSNGMLQFGSHIDIDPVHLFNRGDGPLEFLKKALEAGQVVGSGFTLALNPTSQLLIQSPLVINVAKSGTECSFKMGPAWP